MAKGIPALDIMRKQLKELHGAQVVIGVQGEAGTNMSGETLSSNSELQKIAHVHEYGCDIDVTPKMRAWLHYNGIHLKKETTRIHIPERSYLRQAQANGKAKFRNVAKEYGDKMFLGEISPEEFLKALGQAGLEEVQVAMDDSKTPLTQFTLDRREGGDSTPLMASGRLLRHVTYRVLLKGGSSSGTTVPMGGG